MGHLGLQSPVVITSHHHPFQSPVPIVFMIWRDVPEPDARLLGRAPALDPRLRVRRLRDRHAGRHAAGPRAARGHQPAAAGDVRAEPDHRHRAARRRLLRRDVRRLDDLDPDAHPGRGGLGDDLHRRLRDDAARARRAGARDRRDRLVRRRHAGRGRADAARADARRVRAALRPARVHRAAADGLLHPRLHERRLDAEDAGDGGLRPRCSA